MNSVTYFGSGPACRTRCVERAKLLKGGEPVLVYGRMRINQWVNGERSGTTVEIDAYNGGHDLSWGQTKFVKVAKPQLNQNDRMADPEVQDAADQLDRDAAMADDEFLEDGDGEPATGASAHAASGGIDVSSADTDAYEKVGAGSR